MIVKQKTNHTRLLEIDPVKIRVYRAIKGWTLVRLEEESGVQRKTISKIEKNLSKSIRLDTLSKIANALDKDIEDFRKE